MSTRNSRSFSVLVYALDVLFTLAWFVSHVIGEALWSRVHSIKFVRRSRNFALGKLARVAFLLHTNVVSPRFWALGLPRKWRTRVAYSLLRAASRSLIRVHTFAYNGYVFHTDDLPGTHEQLHWWWGPSPVITQAHLDAARLSYVVYTTGTYPPSVSTRRW